MPILISDLIRRAAARSPAAPALHDNTTTLSYAELWQLVEAAAHGLHRLGLRADDRVAIALPKQTECVVGLFATAAAGGVFVPVNPVLRPAQVAHILRDCAVRILITSPARLAAMATELSTCSELTTIVVVNGDDGPASGPAHAAVISWTRMIAPGHEASRPARIDHDMAALLYTSGSTGQPKGVILSHRNLLAGADSVAGYLGNGPEDRLLAALPISFDYGLSQLTTAFHSGASVALLEYLLPGDVLRALGRYQITGLACVPPLWNQLARLEWPAALCQHLRYITNSGGVLPRATLRALRTALPTTDIYLMYGLTEAFRSTYLAPSEVDRRPDSMGKAIPNAEVLVVRPDGHACGVDEPGELVHRGALVAQGYWNDRQRTAERFRPLPGQANGLPQPEIAVWSGDQVRRDAEGFLYFVSRTDEMMKSSGYRISPTEIEEVAYGAGPISQAVALSLPHALLGQTILLLVEADPNALTEEAVLEHCRRCLPAFMIPQAVHVLTELPRNANGKIDRAALRAHYLQPLAATGQPA